MPDCIRHALLDATVNGQVGVIPVGSGERGNVAVEFHAWMLVLEISDQIADEAGQGNLSQHLGPSGFNNPAENETLSLQPSSQHWRSSKTP